MNRTEQLQYKQIEALIETFNHHLITLAASLEGRLSPADEETLGNLFRFQLNLQVLLTELLPKPGTMPLTTSSPSPRPEEAEGYRQEADSIAHAQAMQYARDLVIAIRQKKEHQRYLELTSQQLIRAEKLATVGQIAATVAHELGNILTPLLMYAKLIYQEATDSEQIEIAEYAYQITRIANRASNMLRQLVDAARSEREMMIPVDLTQVIDNTLNLLSPQIKKQGIKIQRQYVEPLAGVMGHPDQLEQVFINIGLNAFDAMPEGGHFTITLAPGDGMVQPTAKADFITIRFKDTGIGIQPEHIGLLFEPFFTTKERGAGSGLGLFVSHLIIDQHGGAIEVESEPGVGTTFIVKLPTVHKGEDN